MLVAMLSDILLLATISDIIVPTINVCYTLTTEDVMFVVITASLVLQYTFECF